MTQHPQRPHHNHVTRDIKAPGACPACDNYHSSQQTETAPATDARTALAELIAKKHDAFFGLKYAEPAAQDFQLADALMAAGYEKEHSNHFEIKATLTTDEVVTVRVSGYTNIRQGCAALVKAADIKTLSNLIAATENDEDA